MANKEAVFTVKVNTGNSVQDLQNADKAVNQLNKDLKTTQTTAKDSSGTDAMAQRLADLDAKLESGGLSMREMTKAMKEYQNIAIQAGASSPIGAQALQNSAQLKDQIGDLKAQTTALSSDFVGLDTSIAGIEVGAQAFMGVQSAMALAGVENEKLTQTMVKLQAVQGLVNSVTTIANKLNSDSILGIQLRTAWGKIKEFIVRSRYGCNNRTNNRNRCANGCNTCKRHGNGNGNGWIEIVSACVDFHGNRCDCRWSWIVDCELRQGVRVRLEGA